MKKQGFTLMEVLIVVIIIGIFATFAIPNYLRAVERARWAEAASLLSALRSAQLRYKAQYGYYADSNSADNLDITFPANTKFFQIQIDNATTSVAKATRNKVGNSETQDKTLKIDENGTFSCQDCPSWLGY